MCATDDEALSWRFLCEGESWTACQRRAPPQPEGLQSQCCPGRPRPGVPPEVKCPSKGVWWLTPEAKALGFVVKQLRGDVLGATLALGVRPLGPSPARLSLVGATCSEGSPCSTRHTPS